MLFAYLDNRANNQNNRANNQNHLEKKTYPVLCAFVCGFCDFCTEGFLLHQEL